ncbi:MAG: hypothetical protein LBI49_17060 [Nocardiopsaceae bacterium]|jgi:glycerol-3-phosphate responsive antiterminator|nr:hypothetical protein [Nocardiopsaceae bacterium]
MTALEVRVPDDWAPELQPATAQRMDHAVRDGLPIIMNVLPEATPAQIREVYGRIRQLVEAGGIAA